MKQTFTFLSALAVTLAASASSVDFSSLPDGLWNNQDAYTLGSSTDEWATKAFEGNAFTVISFGSRPTGYESTFKNEIGYHYGEYDAWLRSPALAMKAGCSYTVKFQYRVQSGSDFSLKAWVDAGDPTTYLGKTSVKSATPIFSKSSGFPSTWTSVEYTFEAETAGDYYLSYQIYCDDYAEPSGTVYISAVSVQEISKAARPNAPIGLTALPDATGALSVDLAWELPATDEAGGELSGDNALTSVMVYRDGALAVTLPGDATEWTDTEDAGLAPGEHTYAVAVATAMAESQKSETVTTGYVGPFTYAPDEIAFGPWDKYTPSGNAFLTNYTANIPQGQKNSATIWSLNEIAEEDAWLVSPEFVFDPAKTYRVKFQYLSWNDKDFFVENFDVYASALKPSESTVSEIVAAPAIYSLKDISYQDPAWKEVTIDKVKGDGSTYILFHVSGRYCKRFGISAFVLEEYKEEAARAPMVPADLTAVCGEGPAAVLGWTLPTAYVDGEPFGDGVEVEFVRIWRDGGELVTLTGAPTSYTDTEELTYGHHTYAVQVCIGEVWSELSEETSVEIPEPLTLLPIPWEPVLKNLTSEQFAESWVSFKGEGHAAPSGWIARSTGIFFNNATGATEDLWLVSEPLDLVPGTKYMLEYTLTSNNGATASVGITDSTEPEYFIQTVAEPVVMASETEVLILPFTYMPQVNARNHIVEYPRLAVRACSPETGESHNLILSYLRLYENIVDGVTDVMSEVGGIEVYDLGGRFIGRPATLALDGIDKGVYIVRYRVAGETRTLKVCK